MSKLYSHIRQMLSPSCGEHEARAIAFVLLDDVCGLSRTDVLMDRDDELDEPTRQCILSLAQRIADGEPLQYVTGTALFDGLKVGVAPGVLIPRPETEELVAAVSQPVLPTGTVVIDVCSGSGCIALALKHRMPQTVVVGVDVSEPALAIAADNAVRLGLDVDFRKMDVLNDAEWDRLAVWLATATADGWDCKQTETTNTGRHVGLIVSNPPYVCDSEREDMESLVLDHEPHIALFVPDADPLLFYRTITRNAHRLLMDGGVLAFEINRRFGAEVAQLLRDEGFSGVGVMQDAFGNDRIVTGVWRLSEE